MGITVEKEGIFQRFLNLSLKFLFGSTLASIATLTSSLLLAKTLSLKEFGTFALIQAAVATIEGIAFSQSWQAIVRFMPASFHSKVTGVGRLIRICLTTDFTNAAIAIFILFGIATFNNLLNIPESGLLLLYGCILPFRMNGTWQGLARSTEKLYLINIQLITASIIKLLTAILAIFYPDFELRDIVLGFIISEICGFVILLSGALLVGFRYWSLSEIIEDSYKSTEQDGKLIKFIWVNHFNVTSVLAIRSADELMIGRLINVEAVAIYKLIKLLSAVLSKLVEPMYIVIYPEFTRLLKSQNSNYLKELIKKVTLLMSVIGVAFMIFVTCFGDFILNYFSEPVQGDYWTLVIYVFGIVINMVFFYAHPLAIAIGLELFVLNINIITGFIYLLNLWLLGVEFGLLGIAAATLFYSSISTFSRLAGSAIKLKNTH